MKFWRELRAALVIVLIANVGATAHALIVFNDGNDHIHVTGSVTIAYDSNIFANSLSDTGDYIYTATLTAEYARRAGWIGVDATVAVDASRFSSNEGENFNNPRYNLELTKLSGRTTGSFTLNAARESRADPEVNLRSDSWNYGAGLNVKYPVIERYALAGSLGYSLVDYSDNTLYVDLESYSASADLFYVLTPDRDLNAGYRYRENNSSIDTSTIDHAFLVGVSGRVIRSFTGSLRFGYQYRVPKDSTESTLSGWTGSASLTHTFTQKLTLSVKAEKDFSTTATNVSVDRTSSSLDAQYAFNARWNASAGVGYGHTRFLGRRGIDLPSGRQRRDTSLSARAGVGYSKNDKLKISLDYHWSQNWSTIAYSDFIRRGWSLSVSSRW
jgi:Putative beta-barrel porin 2